MNQQQAYQPWYKKYIDLVEGHVIEVLTHQAEDFSAFLLNHRDKADYAYAPGKWTIKQMLGHIIDTERVMAYRLMAFARNDRALMPGFDENEYVANARFEERTLESLTNEFIDVRKSNMHLILALNQEELQRTGIANDNEIAVLALIYILAGHVIHHQNIIKERYL